MNSASLSTEQIAALKNQVENADGKLEEASETVTSHAFNLGCSVGIIPALVAVLLVALLSRGSLPSLLITVLLVGIALLFFATLAAFLARKRTLMRIFTEQIQPEIDASMQGLNLSAEEYFNLAAEWLPANALFWKCAPVTHPSTHNETASGQERKWLNKIRRSQSRN